MLEGIRMWKLEFTRNLEWDQKWNQTNSKFLSQTYKPRQKEKYSQGRHHVKSHCLGFTLWHWEDQLLSVFRTLPLFLHCPFFSQHPLPGATQITSSILFGNFLQEIELVHNKILSQIVLKGFWVTKDTNQFSSHLCEWCLRNQQHSSRIK